MKDLDFNKMNLVTQANNLVEARYAISKNEQLILLAMLSFIDPKDKEFLTYKTSISQFANLLGLDNKNRIKEVKSIMAKLLSRVVTVETPSGWKMYQWVSYAEADYKEDFLLLKFHDHLKPYLLDLKQRFTSFKLSEVIELKSVYAIRIYQLLKDYNGRKQYVFSYSVAEFRAIVLGEGSKKYSIFNNFRVRIIEKSKNELDKKSSLSFSYKTIKVGRSIGKIEFTIINKIQPKQSIKLSANVKKGEGSKEKETSQNKVLLQMLDIGIAKSKAEKYFSQYGSKYIAGKIELLVSDMQLGLVKNPAGYLNSAIIEDWTNNKLAEKKKAKEEQKKKEEKRLETYRQELREKEKKKLRNEFKTKALLEFLSSKSEQERDDLLEKIKADAGSFVGGMIKDLSHPLAKTELEKLIPYFKENQAEYVKQNLTK